MNYNLEAEQAVLSSIIIDTNLLYKAIIEVKEEYFYKEIHKNIFKSIKSLFKANIAIDTVTLIDCIQKDEKVDKNSISVEIMAILNNITTSNNYKYYLNIIKEAYKLRKLINLSDKIKDKSKSYKSSDEIINYIQNQLNESVEENSIIKIKDLKEKMLLDIEKKMDGKESTLNTGIKSYDEVLGGYVKGSLNIIAANTGCGKTTLALNIAERISRNNKKVLIFSLEMDSIQIANKIISSISNIAYYKINKGFMSSKDHNNYINKLEEISNRKISIYDKGMLSIEDILALVKIENAKEKIDLIVIDYIGLIKSNNFKNNRNLQIAEITQNLKNIAREFKTHIIGLAQFNRENEKQKRVPMLADLRDSGAIEQDADTVTFIYNDNSQHDQLIVAKNRHGKCGDLDIMFNREHSLFSEV